MSKYVAYYEQGTVFWKQDKDEGEIYSQTEYSYTKNKVCSTLKTYLWTSMVPIVS